MANLSWNRELRHDVLLDRETANVREWKPDLMWISVWPYATMKHNRLTNRNLMVLRVFQKGGACMEIRQERADDYNIIFQVVTEAFSHAEHSDGNEQELVTLLRATPSFIPELSLVAVEDGKIVGHILFTKITIGEYIELALAPLSVLPAYQRRGIGLALIREGHRIAKQLGYDYSVVLGSPTYYPRAGYLPASLYGIEAPFEVQDEYFMAFKLQDYAPHVKGMVKYDSAFEID